MPKPKGRSRLPAAFSFGTSQRAGPAHGNSKPTTSRIRVLLTGSTGNLGAYLLDALLGHHQVDKVTCLNRSEDAQARQSANHIARGLSVDCDAERLEFLRCDLSSPALGLSDDEFDELAAETTHIIHNAWPVDFNLPFSSFQPHLVGVQRLIEFARVCRYNASIFFISSLSAAGRWGTLPGALAKIPETALHDWRVAKMGYGQSKLVAERLLIEASRCCGITVCICRVGQVAGPVMRDTYGEWPKQEWFPSLIASSINLHKIPDTLGPLDVVDWIPVDRLALVLVELLSQHVAVDDLHRVGKKRKRLPPLAVYHLANPHTSTWSSLLPSVRNHLGDRVQIVSFREWVSALENSNSSSTLTTVATSPGPASPLSNPAVKLLPFFLELQDRAVRFPHARAATLDVRNTARCSSVLACTRAVGAEWMTLWMNQWEVSSSRQEH